jgi:hypothetical protein
MSGVGVDGRLTGVFSFSLFRCLLGLVLGSEEDDRDAIIYRHLLISRILHCDCKQTLDSL